MSRFYVFAGLMLAFFSHAMALDVNQASEAELDGFDVPPDLSSA
jgi:hypothetical protein